MNSYQIKVREGRYLYTWTITPKADRLFIEFPYNEKLKNEVKIMDGARWHPDQKCWSIKNNSRNRFAIQYLGGQNPFAHYEKPLVEFKPRRDCCYAHQVEMTAHVLTRRQCIFACEMGTGKTLAMIEAMESSGHRDWWWCGPKAALYSVRLEFDTWRICDTCRLKRGECKCPTFVSDLCILPTFYTFEALTKVVNNWDDQTPPRGLVIDESSRIKNPKAQRSQACYILAEAIRSQWGDDGWVIEMSGSPAPGKPTDWFWQAEVARPGFIREGDVNKFQRRLAVIQERASITGGTYPHLVTWRDNPDKCDLCGQLKDDLEHDAGMGHPFQPSKDEVSYLYKRMNGLVLVKMKKDCLGLPDKVYRQMQLEAPLSMRNAATLINVKSPSAIQALTLLRELSDGFQYQDEQVGVDTCPLCSGSGLHKEVIDLDCPERPVDSFAINAGRHYTTGDDGEIIYGAELRLGEQEVVCSKCYGDKVVPMMARQVKEVPTPKEQTLKDLLEDHEDVGRLVIFAGFMGSVDRCTSIVAKQGWKYIRVDGRGWSSDLPGDPVDLLRTFQDKKNEDKIAFIGQPGAAGMGLNLTRSPSIVYYSNDFNAESRIQSEDRIHRPGMDVNRGATIYDLLCLPSDLLILNNLTRKRRLQDMSLGQFREEIAAIKFSDIRTYL